MKEINIYVGNNSKNDLFESFLHPKNQIEKVKEYLEDSGDIFSIYSNSIFVVEAFNKFGKLKGYHINFFYNYQKTTAEVIFNGFSEPFEKLIFT